MKHPKIHFAKWVNQKDRSGHLASCGKWNPTSFVFFTLQGIHTSDLFEKITCKKCMQKTTLRDLV